MDKIKLFKDNKIKELDTLKQILESVFPGTDTGPIDTAYKDMQKLEGNTCAYKIKGLIIGIGTLKHIKPIGMRTLKLRIDCDVEYNLDNIDNISDPFNNFSFCVTLFGDHNGQRYSIAWHLDRDAGLYSSEHHPLYHLHYSSGETYIGESNHNWGTAIYIDAPRLSHYPMDIFLGIGWCVTNFFSKPKFDTLKRNIQFVRIYKSAQQSILRPYFHSLANNWEFDKRKIKWDNSNVLCPQII